MEKKNMSITTNNNNNNSIPLFNRINELLSNNNSTNSKNLLITASSPPKTTFKINTASTSPSLSPSSISSSSSLSSSSASTGALNNNNNNNIPVMGQPKSVSCSFVKSNTNIYYNVKVDNCASKAIHYCLNCSNYNCKAIHKSVCKAIEKNNTQPLQQARLSFNKSNGPNVNFIFERRYPTTHNNNNSNSNQINLHTLLPSLFPNNGALTPTTSATTNTTPTLSPNQQLLVNRPSTEFNNFPLPLSPITSTNLSINLNNDNDLVNLLNLNRSFRNTLVLDQVRDNFLVEIKNTLNAVRSFFKK